MRNAVQRIYKERKALMASLKDMSRYISVPRLKYRSFSHAYPFFSAVAKLDGVLIGVGLLIVLFICLLIFNPGDTVTSLVPLATIVLGFRYESQTKGVKLFFSCFNPTLLSFIFGHSAQLLFESVSLNCLSTHPIIFD